MQTKKTNRIFLATGLVFSLAALVIFGKLWRFVRFPDIVVGKASTTVAIVPKKGDLRLFLPLISAKSSFVSNYLGPANAEPEGEWMKFADLDLLESDLGFQFSIDCGESVTIDIPPTRIIAWYPEVFEDQEFGIGKNSAVAWEHLGYEGLWMHSGWDFWSERSPATDLQYFLETDSINEVQPLSEMEKRLNSCLRGSQVRLKQQEQVTSARVVAAVRVPAVEVDELSRHTMDLVPYLGQAYPQSGFAELSPDAMLIYFCGRAALDELTDPDAGYWTQARFVIAIEPDN